MNFRFFSFGAGFSLMVAFVLRVGKPNKEILYPDSINVEILHISTNNTPNDEGESEMLVRLAIVRFSLVSGAAESAKDDCCPVDQQSLTPDVNAT
jgi:hypothetical protein